MKIGNVTDRSSYLLLGIAVERCKAMPTQYGKVEGGVS
jgi:hypothetical protein